VFIVMLKVPNSIITVTELLQLIWRLYWFLLEHNVVTEKLRCLASERSPANILGPPANVIRSLQHANHRAATTARNMPGRLPTKADFPTEVTLSVVPRM
jgi:hypothetical protein